MPLTREIFSLPVKQENQKMGKWGYIGAYNYKPVLVYLVSTRGILFLGRGEWGGRIRIIRKTRVISITVFSLEKPPPIVNDT